MKKQILFLVVIFSLILNNVFSLAVYVTKSGTKYHELDCRYLRHGFELKNLSDAIVLGYLPCSVCNPSSNANNSQLKPGYTIEPGSTNYRPDNVIICDGNYATKYHKSKNCNGLQNCKGNIYEIPKSEAVKRGRTPCAICY